MEEFIKTLTGQMRCAKARSGVARELEDHIMDQAQAYEQSGMEHDKAVSRAVCEMGDPVEIGVSMDRIHRPQTDWRMLLLTFLLSIAGLFCMIPMYGAGRMLTSQGLLMLGGFVLIAAVYFIDYSVIGRIGAAAYIVMTILFLVLHIYLPVIQGRQTALFIMVYLYVPLFAGILYRLRMRGYRAVIAGIAVIGVTAVAVICFTGNIVAAMNISLIMIAMLVAAIGKGMFGGNKKHMTAVVAVILLIASLIVSLWYIGMYGMDYRRVRLDAFFHRDQYREGAGYVYAVIEDVLKNAKYVGRASSIYLEGPDSASITFLEGELMPVGIIYSYGIIVGGLMLVLLAVLILRAMKIVRGQKNQLGFLVSMACFLVLFVNCLEGILVGVGLFPITTTAIPFLTRGGSATFVYAALIGLLMSVHRYEKVYTEERYDNHFTLQVHCPPGKE